MEAESCAETSCLVKFRQQASKRTLCQKLQNLCSSSNIIGDVKRHCDMLFM